MKKIKTNHTSQNRNELIVLDQNKIFEEEKQRCLFEQERLDALKAELKEFEELDLPCFTGWMYQNFGAEIKLIHELSSEAMEKNMLFHEVQDQICYGGSKSYQTAYKQVLRNRANGIQIDHLEDYKATYGTEEDLGNDPETEEKPKTEKTKVLYRELARRLHPDVNKDQDSSHRSLWHQTQAAYEENDLKQLEVLIHRTTTLSKEEARSLQLRNLAKTLRDLKKAVAQIQRLLRDAKKEPAWEFRKNLEDEKQIHRLKNRLHSEFKEDKKELQERIASFNDLFESWKQPLPPFPNQKQSSRGRGKKASKSMR